MALGSLTLSSGKRLYADLSLLLVAAIWGSAFVAQRVAAAHLGFFTYNGMRFLLGALTLWPIVQRPRQNATRTEWWGGLLAGLLLAGASALQQAGLQFTTAGKAGFITGLYVVLVPLLLALGWRQPPRWLVWAGSLLAAMGLFLLSADVSSWSLAPGDGLEVAGALLWAFHVILIGHLAGRVSTLRLAWLQFLVCGLLSTALGLGLELHTFGGLRLAWWSVLYGGILSVGVGYTLQVIGQQVAPPADAAVILSMEAVFAAIFGWLLLDERLTSQQIVGCGLMLAGMLLAQVSNHKQVAGKQN